MDQQLARLQNIFIMSDKHKNRFGDQLLTQLTNGDPLLKPSFNQ